MFLKHSEMTEKNVWNGLKRPERAHCIFKRNCILDLCKNYSLRNACIFSCLIASLSFKVFSLKMSKMSKILLILKKWKDTNYSFYFLQNSVSASVVFYFHGKVQLDFFFWGEEVYNIYYNSKRVSFKVMSTHGRTKTPMSTVCFGAQCLEVNHGKHQLCLHTTTTTYSMWKKGTTITRQKQKIQTNPFIFWNNLEPRLRHPKINQLIYTVMKIKTCFLLLLLQCVHYSKHNLAATRK